MTAAFSAITEDVHAGYLWIAGILCVIYTLLTITVRGTLKWGNYGLDDLLIALATLMHLAQSASIFAGLHNGLGKSIEMVQNVQVVGDSLTTQTIFFIITLCLAKGSVICLCKRIFSRSNDHFEAGCYVMLGAVAVWAIGSIVAVNVPCASSQLLAEPESPQCSGDSLRWKIVMVLDAITELAIFIMPLAAIWKVKMQIKRKAQVLAFFSFRLPLIGLSIVFIIFGKNKSFNTNTTLGAVPGVAIQLAEVCWSLLSATMIVLKPFLESFNTGLIAHSKSTDSSVNSSYHRPSVPGANTEVSRTRYNATTYELSEMDEEKKLRSTLTSVPDEPLPLTFQEKSVAQPINVTMVTADVNLESTRENGSLESYTGSQDLIIRRDVKWDVESHRKISA